MLPIMNKTFLLGAAVAVLLCVSVRSLAAEEVSAVPHRFDEIIESVCAQYGVDALLVKALIGQESRFDPRASGAHGEIGLMQVKRSVAQDWAKAHSAAAPTAEELYDPYQNIMIGVWCLKRALDKWEKDPNVLLLALCEYNAGRSKLLLWIAHCDGDTADAVFRNSSASYVRMVRDRWIALRFRGEAGLLATNP